MFGIFLNLIFNGFGEIWLLPLESHRNSASNDVLWSMTLRFRELFEILVDLGKILVYKLMIWTCIWCPGHVFGVLGRV